MVGEALSCSASACLEWPETRRRFVESSKTEGEFATERASVRFAAGGQDVSLALHNRPYATARDDWDRDLVTATIAVTIGAFRGGVATALWAREIAHLHHLLVDLQQHVGREQRAAFATIEPALGPTFRLSRLGHLHVDVQLSSNVGLDSEATLTFSLAADQSYLPAWIAARSHALDVFPPSLPASDTAPDVHRK
jgi:hypothetical protein